jgi:hypothetical protein
MQFVLVAVAVISLIVAVLGLILDLDFAIVLSFLTALGTVATYLATRKPKGETESLDQRNRRVMLDHVENFWIKGILEKSLHGVALLDLGIREEPGAVSYPWTIKRESTDETLPAGKPMLDIFQEIGMGRSLLILGAPGSGKTTMLLDLTRQLIQRARNDEDEPIPVVFNLASWKENQTLAGWLAEELNIFYRVPKQIAPAWVKGNRMLLLLDGLDEVQGNDRAKCVEAINQFRKEYGLTAIAVCSRSGDYAAIKTRLSFEGAIALQPLTSGQIDAYIDRFGNSLSSIRLLLRNDDTLKELAETPLMLSIMSLAYKDKRVDELMALDNTETQRKHLFDMYIDSMFQRTTRLTNADFTKSETLHFLNWLARTMIRHNLMTYQIEAMQPSWLEKQSDVRLYKLYAGLIVRLSFGLIVGLSFGLSFGLIVGLRAAQDGGLIFGLSVGLSFGLLFGYSPLIQHYSLRWLLTRRQLLPRQLIPFLEYAVGLIFLHRVGGSYIFIHRLLMEHFAEMEV